jgi:hypothetical protein
VFQDQRPGKVNIFHAPKRAFLRFDPFWFDAGVFGHLGMTRDFAARTGLEFFKRVRCNAGKDALQELLVRRFIPGKTPGIVKAGMQAPGEIESASHQRSPT